MKRESWFGVVLCASVLSIGALLPSLVCAAEPAADTPAVPSDDAQKPPPNLQTSPYQGVVPGGDHLPPRAPKLPLKSGRDELTWVGFRVVDNEPRVFLQLAASPDYAIDVAPHRVTVTLKNTAVHLRNTSRALLTQDFGTAVTRVQAQAAGTNVRVVITTTDKGPPAPEAHVENSAGGFQLLVIALPPVK